MSTKKFELIFHSITMFLKYRVDHFYVRPTIVNHEY